MKPTYFITTDIQKKKALKPHVQYGWFHMIKSVNFSQNISPDMIIPNTQTFNNYAEWHIPRQTTAY